MAMVIRAQIFNGIKTVEILLSLLPNPNFKKVTHMLSNN